MRLIPARDPTATSLAECCEALSVWGFDPREDESVAHAANWLCRLANNRDFLGDQLIDLLAERRQPGGKGSVVSPAEAGNRLILSASGRGSYSIHATIWPSPGEALLRASGPEAFGYGIAQDFCQDFLEIGYFGPGCSRDEWEYAAHDVQGWAGEPVALTSLGRITVPDGQIAHYRTNRDVRRVHVPESISVTLSLSHVHPSLSWKDHYLFDPEAGRIRKVMGDGSSEAFLRIAVGLGGEEAIDLAWRFARHHPSDRMRLAAWRALAGRAPSNEARDEVWRDAELTGSRRLAAFAARRRQEQV